MEVSGVVLMKGVGNTNRRGCVICCSRFPRCGNAGGRRACIGSWCLSLTVVWRNGTIHTYTYYAVYGGNSDQKTGPSPGRKETHLMLITNCRRKRVSFQLILSYMSALKADLHIRP